jgi:hypothetical protein
LKRLALYFVLFPVAYVDLAYDLTVNFSSAKISVYYGADYMAKLRILWTFYLWPLVYCSLILFGLSSALTPVALTVPSLILVTWLVYRMPRQRHSYIDSDGCCVLIYYSLCGEWAAVVGPTKHGSWIVIVVGSFTDGIHPRQLHSDSIYLRQDVSNEEFVIRFPNDHTLKGPITLKDQSNWFWVKPINPIEIGPELKPH